LRYWVVSGDVLLMLDNLDPLFNADKGVETSRLLKQLLTDCPGLRMLSTCRRQLQLGGYESDVLVDPLASQVSVSLFIQAIPDQDVRNKVKSLPQKSLKYAVDLVDALQGHPLSIFLAAHRIVAGHDPIAQQLEQATKGLVKLLEAPDLVGVPPRQRSLRASMDLSYDLLSERSQEIFRKSSLLPGGLYRHVGTLDPLLGDDWREAVEEAEKIGLVRYNQDEQRFWLLNPVREYAEQLLDDKEGADFKVAVAKHWAEFAGLYDFLLNPAQNLQAMETLELPTEAKQRRESLAQLHSQAFAALSSEEANILFGFRIGLEHDVEAARQISSGLMDYMNLYDKRQTNAWLARSMLEVSRTPETRASPLNILGNMLSNLGDRQGALEATRESLEIRRTLAVEHPEAFLPDMASSLNNLGAMLSETGDRQGALEAVRESLEIHRMLAKEHREAFLPDVAMSLNNIGTILSETGDREGALRAGSESLEIYRKLAEEHPEAFLPYVATSLNNLGNRLSEMGDRQGALEAARDSLGIRKHLAKEHPEAFLPQVATALNNLGNRLSEMADRQGALNAARESSEIYRRLAEEHPEAFLPDVAMSLNNLGNRLSELGDRQGALQAARESSEIYGTLAKEHPEAFLPYVATSLNNLGRMLSEVGDRQGALEAARESVDIRRNLAKEHPEAFLPDVAMSLNNLGTMLSELGDRQGALEAACESLNIRRNLAEEHPEAFLPDVAMSLNNLGNRLSEVGDWQGALEAARESLEFYRKLAEEHPEAFLSDVAMSLNNLSTMLAETGDREGALVCFREVVEIGERYHALVGNPAVAVQGSIRLADSLAEQSAPEALAVLDHAATFLEPLWRENRAALGDMIEVNQRRVGLLEGVDPSQARQVASQLEEQRRLYGENGEAA